MGHDEFRVNFEFYYVIYVLAFILAKLLLDLAIDGFIYSALSQELRRDSRYMRLIVVIVLLHFVLFHLGSSGMLFGVKQHGSHARMFGQGEKVVLIVSTLIKCQLIDARQFF